MSLGDKAAESAWCFEASILCNLLGWVVVSKEGQQLEIDC